MGTSAQRPVPLCQQVRISLTAWDIAATADFDDNGGAITEPGPFEGTKPCSSNFLCSALLP